MDSSANRKKNRVLLSLRWTASLVAAILVAGTGFLSSTLTLDSMRQNLEQEARLQLVLDARDLALSSSGALLSEFPELSLVPLCKDLINTRQDIADVVVVDYEGVIAGTTEARRIGSIWHPGSEMVVIIPGFELRPDELMTAHDPLLRVETPIRYQDQESSVLGKVIMTLDTSYVDARIRAESRRQLQLGLALVSLAFLFTALVMSLLFRPFSTLKRGLERIGQGDLETPIRIRDFSELGMLGEAVNDMAGQIRASQRLAEAREQEVLDTQKEVIHTLGEVVEGRSSETANHTRRVGDMSYELALLVGLSQEEADLIRHASPMHDVGKIGIPDDILNKPGKLTDQEYRQMQAHPEIGFRILDKSERPLIKAAAIIAHQHHERWDGKGYPRGIAGEDIHIFGRIVALVDVFDALFSNRVYRRAMPLEKVLGIIKEGRGTHFQAELVDTFLANLKVFLSIAERFEDAPMDRPAASQPEVPDQPRIGNV